MSTYESRYGVCAAPGCGLKPTPWSRYCSGHTSRIFTNGHYKALGVRDVELQRHRKSISRALTAYRELPAVQAALAEANALLNWRAPVLVATSKQFREFEQQMTRLRDGGTFPMEVLQRACEVFFLEHDGYFPDQRACQFALARSVLKLRCLHKWRANSRLLRVLGEEVHERFAVFALALRKRIEADQEAAKERKHAMLTGWSSDAVAS